MKLTRSFLLLVSAVLVFSLVSAGLMVQAGSEDNSYSQAVLFSEIFNLVQDNYVDPVEGVSLLDGAYESMLGGLDPNGAYLSPAEVESWNSGLKLAGPMPAISVLKLGRTLQIVAVAEGSSAADAGIRVGDQIRTIGGLEIANLSLGQVRQALRGKAGTPVKLELVHPFDDFERETVEVLRETAKSRPYSLESKDGVGYLRLHRIGDIDRAELASELEGLAGRGTEQLLIDLRNSADDTPRDVSAVASLFVEGFGLSLRGRDGEILERAAADTMKPVWIGTISMLVNGATAGGAEGLAQGLRTLAGDRVSVYGEESFGLGAEPKLFPLENGGGLLVSSERWEVDADHFWHGVGITPDEVVRGTGTDYAEAAADQLQRVLTMIREKSEAAEEDAAAA